MDKNIFCNSIFPIILLAIALAVIGILGVVSVDIGYHWDEKKIISSVSDSAETGLLLPRWYNYPSISYSIGLITAIPYAIMVKLGIKSNLVEYFNSSFKLHLRAVFFLISMCSGLAIFLFVSNLTKSRWIGLFSTVALLSSMEYIYHARWIAPDAILTVFITCSIGSQYRILMSKDKSRVLFWTIISSIFAGLCIGTKYPGGIILVSLFIAILLNNAYNFRELFTLCFALVVFTFIMTTPGIFLDLFNFWKDLLYEIRHYKSGHGGYTVAAGFEHFKKIILYLLFVVPSSNVMIAAIFTLFSMVGVFFLLKVRLLTALWLLSTPCLYVLYMSMQKVMIARNYLWNL